MLIRRILIILTLALPQIALSNYDPEKIKNAISSNPDLFLVSGWQQGEHDGTWIGKTTQKWITISINEKQSEIISPYINAQQIAVAKTRCVELASSGLSVASKADRNSITKLIDDSSQHHRLKYLEMNHVRFEVTPKLVGAFVKLFCVVKPIH